MLRFFNTLSRQVEEFTPIEDNKVLLTGSAQSPQQVQRAGEIAKAHAGEGLVVNAILDIRT